MPSKAKRNGSAQTHGIAAQPCENDIRCRAYEIYIARGEHPGRDLDDWLQAERELGAFEAKSAAAASE
jgi:DUF2934 family protein